MGIGSLLFFGCIKGLYLLASLIRVPQGGWPSLVLAMIFMVVVYGTMLQEESICTTYKTKLLWNGSSHLAHWNCWCSWHWPGLSCHILTFRNKSSCIKSVRVSYVPAEECYLIGRIGPKVYRMYRCFVRYGYKDAQKYDNDFKNHLILSFAEFIQIRQKDHTPQGVWLIGWKDVSNQ